MHALTVRDRHDNVGTDSITVKVLSYLEVFPWWILGIIAVIGAISGAILFWKRKAHAKERARSKSFIYIFYEFSLGFVYL